MSALYVIATTTTAPLDELDDGDTASLFWNEADGFGDLESATVYSETEAAGMSLPFADDQPIWVALPRCLTGGRA